MGRRGSVRHAPPYFAPSTGRYTYCVAMRLAPSLLRSGYFPDVSRATKLYTGNEQEPIRVMDARNGPMYQATGGVCRGRTRGTAAIN